MTKKSFSGAFHSWIASLNSDGTFICDKRARETYLPSESRSLPAEHLGLRGWIPHCVRILANSHQSSHGEKCSLFVPCEAGWFLTDHSGSLMLCFVSSKNPKSLFTHTMLLKFPSERQDPIEPTGVKRVRVCGIPYTRGDHEADISVINSNDGSIRR
mmetsp:Transcript_8703/g.17657  ORF Transcript_8703/g.17657 Transcript_8703/m.17657 type:complete len:157 (-) Transcript_8703:261-731(-)